MLKERTSEETIHKKDRRKIQCTSRMGNLMIDLIDEKQQSLSQSTCATGLPRLY